MMQPLPAVLSVASFPTSQDPKADFLAEPGYLHLFYDAYFNTPTTSDLPGIVRSLQEMGYSG